MSGIDRVITTVTNPAGNDIREYTAHI